MSAYPQIHVRMETSGLPLTTVTILIHEDSLAAIASHLDTLERLIAEYGAKAFFGEPDTEPPQQTAEHEVTRSAARPRSATTNSTGDHDALSQH
jgi:hypothetical protein